MDTLRSEQEVGRVGREQGCADGTGVIEMDPKSNNVRD